MRSDIVALTHLSLGPNNQVGVTLADAHLQQYFVHSLDHLQLENKRKAAPQQIVKKAGIRTKDLSNLCNFPVLDQRGTHPNIEQQRKELLLPWRQPRGLEVEVELDKL